MKSIFNNVFAVLTIAALLVGSALIAYPAVSQLAGLAVAQSATRWNNVIDAAKGDNQSSGILGISLYMWDGLNFDRARGDTTNGVDVDVTRISGSTTPADDFANPTTTNTMFSLGAVFDGSTWDRQREPTADALAVTGITAAGNMLFNTATWDRARTASGDNLAATGLQAIVPMGFDGTTYDRSLSVSNTNNTATTSSGVAYTAPLSTWSQTNSANAGTPSTVKAAGGGTVRHVATCISISVGAAATAQPVVQVNLRDGASGAGTIIRSWQLAAIANSHAAVDLCGLNITGSANTAMTLEFAAATAANTQATVNLSGYSTP